MENDAAFELFSKRFVAVSVAAALLIGGASWYLWSLDIPYTENDQIRKYQLEKLERSKDIDLLIVGDSAAGNAIDAEQFGVLTGAKALNVALTGSFGIEGSLSMVRQALRLGQPIRYVVIIQTLDMWHRPFSEEGLVDTSRGLEGCAIKKMCRTPFAATRYILNPKELFWFFRYVASPPAPLVIENDYRKQNSDTFVNGGKFLRGNIEIPDSIDAGKEEAFYALDALCEERKLVCVYMHAPLHKEVGGASTGALESVNRMLLRAHSIRVDTALTLFDGTMMGDSIDHVAPGFKATTTKAYAEKFNFLLRDHFAD